MKKIIVDNVSKEFKDQVVLQDVNLELTSGKIIGLVGANGSGKSVFMKMLVGLMKPTSGTIILDEDILGKDIDFPKSSGVIIEKPGFFDEFDGIKNLKILADIKKEVGEEEIQTYFKLVGLDCPQKKVGKYSLGMKQRLAIAQALMETPELLVLDEVSNGLDRKGRELVYQLLTEYKSDNRIIILSSHSENEINVLCDEVYEVDDSTIVKR